MAGWWWSPGMWWPKPPSGEWSLLGGVGIPLWQTYHSLRLWGGGGCPEVRPEDRPVSEGFSDVEWGVSPVCGVRVGIPEVRLWPELETWGWWWWCRRWWLLETGALEAWGGDVAERWEADEDGAAPRTEPEETFPVREAGDSVCEELDVERLEFGLSKLLFTSVLSVVVFGVTPAGGGLLQWTFICFLRDEGWV